LSYRHRSKRELFDDCIDLLGKFLDRRRMAHVEIHDGAVLLDRFQRLSLEDGIERFLQGAALRNLSIAPRTSAVRATAPDCESTATSTHVISKIVSLWILGCTASRISRTANGEKQQWLNTNNSEKRARDAGESAALAAARASTGD